MYILKCSNGLFYIGSTRNLEKRVQEHNLGLGANFTRRNLPVELVYYEEFQLIDDAYAREKQVQGWSHEKKATFL
jgi:putative endonuclease